MSSPAKVKKLPLKSSDLPTTQGMLHLVRNELKSEMKSGFKLVDARFNQMESKFDKVDAHFNQMESKFDKIDARFNQMEARFESIDSRFKEGDSKFRSIDARFDIVDSKLERVLAEVSRIGMLVEEQNSRNRVVLEGLTGLWHRQDRVETRVDEVEKTVRTIGRSK